MADDRLMTDFANEVILRGFRTSCLCVIEDKTAIIYAPNVASYGVNVVLQNWKTEFNVRSMVNRLWREIVFRIEMQVVYSYTPDSNLSDITVIARQPLS